MVRQSAAEAIREQRKVEQAARSARLLMAMVEMASAAAMETATATFPSAVKVATWGHGSHRAAVVGASIGEIIGGASR